MVVDRPETLPDAAASAIARSNVDRAVGDLYIHLRTIKSLDQNLMSHLELWLFDDLAHHPAVIDDKGAAA